MNGVEPFVEKCRELLELEREEELLQSTEALKGQSIKRLAERGLCLNRLRYQYTYTGLYGRTILVFDGDALSRAQTFGPGDIAAIYRQAASIDDQAPLARGLIFRMTPTAIHLTVEENDDEQFNATTDTCHYIIVKVANDVTYRRLKHGLTLMLKERQGIAYNLLDIAFDKADPIPTNFDENSGPSQWFNENLDLSQKQAVSFALASRDISIFHGPPGTGKTTTIVEYILQEALKREAKILCCAPSNIAVDNLVERLGKKKQLRMIRLGHPARLLESIQRFSLESIVMENYQDVKNALREDLNQCCVKLRKTSNDRGERERLKVEIRNLRKDIRMYEEKASREAMKSVNVILCTLTSATDDGPLRLLPKNHFDLVVIDECSQALEAACWLALLRAPKCVLAGDHLQLPPTILSDKAAKEGLAITLMQRMIETLGDKITRMLTIQYRMHEAIMNWSSNEFYDGKLTADQSVKTHLLDDLSNVSKRDEEEFDDDNLAQCPLYLIDTTGYDMPEIRLDDESSRANEGEAALVAVHVDELVKNYGVSIDQIGVITPYNMQVQFLRQKLLPKYPTLEIKSVDGFQGREKEVIIISMVRSNKHGEVGFLSDSRRINVAITRARRHLCIVCNAQTVTHDPFIKRLINYMQEYGQVRSAFELVDGDTFFQGGSTTQTKPPSSKSTKKQAPPRSNKSAVVKPTSERSEATNTLENVLTRVLDQRIEAFLQNSNVQHLQFEAGLSPFGRRYVHELAEKHNLQHVSEGVGDQRQITISKRPLPEKKIVVDDTTEQFRSFSLLEEEKKSPKLTRKLSDLDPVLPMKVDEIEIESPLPPDTSNLCRYCQKDIPPQNRQLHELYCQRVNPLSNLPVQSSTPSASANPINIAPERSKTIKKKENKIASLDAQAPIDDLLAAARRQDNVCNAERCKIKITLLGQLCSYCNRRYCFEHSMPEVHGCGHQARKDMRQTHLSTHANLQPVYDSKTNAVSKEKRPHLERKLQDKITAKENQRKKK